MMIDEETRSQGNEMVAIVFLRRRKAGWSVVADRLVSAESSNRNKTPCSRNRWKELGCASALLTNSFRVRGFACACQQLRARK